MLTSGESKNLRIFQVGYLEGDLLCGVGVGVTAQLGSLGNRVHNLSLAVRPVSVRGWAVVMICNNSFSSSWPNGDRFDSNFCSKASSGFCTSCSIRLLLSQLRKEAPNTTPASKENSKPMA